MGHDYTQSAMRILNRNSLPGAGSLLMGFNSTPLIPSGLIRALIQEIKGV